MQYSNRVLVLCLVFSFINEQKSVCLVRDVEEGGKKTNINSLRRFNFDCMPEQRLSHERKIGYEKNDVK